MRLRTASALAYCVTITPVRLAGGCGVLVEAAVAAVSVLVAVSCG